MKRLSWTALIFSLFACSHGFIFDPSMEAVQAGDYTLTSSLCEATPNGGMDVCHVTEGTAISSSWKLILPTGSGIYEGEVDVYYRSIQKSYAVTGKTVEIPWKDFFGDERWDGSKHDGEALALALVRYKNAEGIVEIAKYRGIAKIVVTKPGYDRLPIDSGFAGWKTSCRIQHTTAGRSAVSCK